MAIRIQSADGVANAFGIVYDSRKPYGGLPRPTSPHITGFTNPRGITVMWSVYVDAHTLAFGANWFLARQNGTFEGANYFGTSTRQVTGSWYHSLSCNTQDHISSETITLGRWYRQALRRRENGASSVDYDYFWDLPSLTKVVTVNMIPGVEPPFVLGSSHQFRFGDVTWATNEGIDGRIGAVKVWENWLTKGAIAAEAASMFPVAQEYLPTLWGCWPLTRVGDMRDYSGRGNNFSIIADAGSSLRTIGDPSIAKTSRLLHMNTRVIFPTTVAASNQLAWIKA